MNLRNIFGTVGILFLIGCGPSTVDVSNSGTDGTSDATADSSGIYELKRLRLQTGSYWCGADPVTNAWTCGFTPFEVHVNMDFEISGCGFTRNDDYGDGGESIFS